MIEALKDLTELIKGLPNHAMWILLGFLFYKLFIVGSVYGCIRLGINKIHDYLIRPKETIIKYDVEGHFINAEVYLKFQDLVGQMHNSLEKANPHTIPMQYMFLGKKWIHTSDIDIMKTALLEYFKKRAEETRPKTQTVSVSVP